MFADNMDLLSLTRWRLTCKTNYEQAVSSLRRSLLTMLDPFMSQPLVILDILTQHHSVLGGEFALAFILRDRSLLPTHLDIFCSDYEFNPLCSSILDASAIRKEIKSHEYTDLTILDALRTLISCVLTIHTTRGTTIRVHRSYTTSPTAPISRASCTALSNFVTAYGFGCSHPLLTLQRRALVSDQELPYIPIINHDVHDNLIKNNFSLVFSPTAWLEFRRYTLGRKRASRRAPSGMHTEADTDGGDDREDEYSVADNTLVIEAADGLGNVGEFAGLDAIEGTPVFEAASDPAGAHVVATWLAPGGVDSDEDDIDDGSSAVDISASGGLAPGSGKPDNDSSDILARGVSSSISSWPLDESVLLYPEVDNLDYSIPDPSTYGTTGVLPDLEGHIDSIVTRYTESDAFLYDNSESRVRAVRLLNGGPLHDTCADPFLSSASTSHAFFDCGIGSSFELSSDTSGQTTYDATTFTQYPADGLPPFYTDADTPGLPPVGFVAPVKSASTFNREVCLRGDVNDTFSNAEVGTSVDFDPTAYAEWSLDAGAFVYNAASAGGCSHLDPLSRVDTDTATVAPFLGQSASLPVDPAGTPLTVSAMSSRAHWSLDPGCFTYASTSRESVTYLGGGEELSLLLRQPIETGTTPSLDSAPPAQSPTAGIDAPPPCTAARTLPLADSHRDPSRSAGAPPEPLGDNPSQRVPTIAPTIHACDRCAIGVPAALLPADAQHSDGVGAVARPVSGVAERRAHSAPPSLSVPRIEKPLSEDISDGSESEIAEYGDDATGTETEDDHPGGRGEQCWRHRYVCPSQGRFFGDRGSFVEFFDPLRGGEEYCVTNNIAPFGPMVVWRVLSNFNCEEGCDIYDDVLEEGVTSIPVLIRRDPFGDLRDVVSDRRLGGGLYRRRSPTP